MAYVGSAVRLADGTRKAVRDAAGDAASIRLADGTRLTDEAVATVDYLVSPIAIDGGASISIAAPAGYDTGGLLVAFYVQDARRGLTPSAGWTLLESQTQSQGDDRGMAIYSRNADGGANDTLTLTHSSNDGRGFMVSFPTGATVIDSDVLANTPTSTPPSNAGGLSGAADDIAIWCMTGQTNVITSIDTYPSPTDAGTELGPFAYGTETMAGSVGTLVAAPGTGAWAIGTADHRWIAGCVIVNL